MKKLNTLLELMLIYFKVDFIVAYLKVCRRSFPVHSTI